MNHVQLMDRIYRYQRYIYDATRKHFLLGRDRLLQMMAVRSGEGVLEMGAGTARNLMLLHRRCPGAEYFGLDASHEMIEYARGKLAARGIGNIRLTQCLAERLDHRQTFGRDEPFDKIFFSYSLSMIPPWKEALQAAMRNLKPGGTIYIVDFWDQGGLPGWFRRLLTWWLALFHVKHEPALIEELQRLDREGQATLDLIAHRRRYTFLAKLSAIRLESSDKPESTGETVAAHEA